MPGAPHCPPEGGNRMSRLLLRAYLLLIRVDLLMKFRSFRSVLDLVRRKPIGRTTRPEVDIQEICHAVDLASVLYMKPVACLQRSAATTVLLKRYGWSAQLVIGAQTLPFKSHAWTEIDGQVVNDKPYMSELYSVLERC